MTSAAAAMISGGTAMATGNGGEGTGAGTGTRTTTKDGRASLVPTPDGGGVLGGRSIATRSLTSSPASTSLSCSSSPTLPLAGLLMHEPDRIRMRSSAGSKRRRVKDFNDGITCTLCSGYLVEATTVNDCLHTFCRSCIVKYLESNKYCPRCKSYNSKPITAANLRPDRTLRALVYKLVPGLYKSENQRMVNFYAEISSSNNVVPFGDDHLAHGALSLLDDQNFFSPDEPISLSLEYHNETLGEHSAASAKVPITYLQCPAAVTVHHLYKFILTKNGLLVGADHIRVEIIYEDEVLPPDFTLMDVAYCFCYKRIAPMRFFYRILIHSTAKPTPTASTSQNRVAAQDKNSTDDGRGTSTGGSSATTATTHGISSPTPTTAGRGTDQRQGEPRQQQQQPKQQQPQQKQQQLPAMAKEGLAKAAPVRPREDDANYSRPVVGATGGKKETNGLSNNGVNGHPSVGDANRAAGKSLAPASMVDGGEKKATGENVSPPGAAVTTKKAAPGSLKVVLVTGGTVKSKPSSPVRENSVENPATVQQSTPKPPSPGAKEQSTTGSGTSGELQTELKPVKVSAAANASASEKPIAAPSTTNELKCYVNLKKQTVVGGATPTSAEKLQQAQQQLQHSQSLAEIPRLKIDLPRLKTKLSVPGAERKGQGTSPPSSSSSSAATSPASAASSSGGISSSSSKSPVWPMGKEEYAKTIGLKPVYAVVPSGTGDEQKHSEMGSSSSHRKRKKGKHSKEAGSSGKRRKLHAEISSQHDASLKMKVKLTEKPPKHERLKSSGNEDEVAQPVSPSAQPPSSQVTGTVAPQPKPTSPPVVATKTPPQEVVSSTMPKVIDITKDDDDVKFVATKPSMVAGVKPPARKSPPLEPAAPVVTVATTSVPPAAGKDKLSEMRAIRHKPMVYIPNLDRSLSADASISSFMESVQPKAQPTPRPTVTSAAASVVGAILKPTPALIPASTASTLAGKSQPRTPILSPRTMQSYPPLAYPLTSSGTATPGVNSGSIRSMAPPPMKRSISSDGGGSPHHQPKLPRLDPPSLVAPAIPLSHSTMPNKQPIHAPMFNFAKGANRAKAAQQAAGIGNQSQAQTADIPYRSPISSTYTKEMVTKKPIPNLLLPPSSISVTKMSDIVSSSCSSSSGIGTTDNRPALEIVRIPPTAPVADKPSLAPFTTTSPKPTGANGGNGTPKTTRPPPATIPLVKIKKPMTTTTTTTPSSDGATVSSSSATTTASTTSPPRMTPLAVTTTTAGTMRPPKMATGSGQSILDLSGGRQLSDEVIILDQSPVKGAPSSVDSVKSAGSSLDRELGRLAAAVTAAANRRASIPGLKLPHDMIGFPLSGPSTAVTSSSLVTPSSGGGQKTLAPLPKLTEIHRNRNLAVRQPNASIRNIPNPSALAFRGSSQASVAPPVTTSIALSSAQSSAGMSITSSGLIGANRTNGNATTLALAKMTSTFKTVSPGAVQLSNGASVRTPAGLNGSSADTNSPSVNGGGAHNNNNTKLANANTTPGAGGKKTIENVAAVLKAAAATVDNTGRGTTGTSSAASSASAAGPGIGSSTSATFSTTTNGGEGRKKSPSHGHMTPPRGAASSTTTTSSTISSSSTIGSSSTTTTMATGSRNGGNGEAIATSVTTPTMASVTGTNGTARASPAGIVKAI